MSEIRLRQPARRLLAWSARFRRTSGHAVAACGPSFAMVGCSSGSADFNPGMGIDLVFGDIIYLSRKIFDRTAA